MLAKTASIARDVLRERYVPEVPDVFPGRELAAELVKEGATDPALVSAALCLASLEYEGDGRDGILKVAASTLDPSHFDPISGAVRQWAASAQPLHVSFDNFVSRLEQSASSEIPKIAAALLHVISGYRLEKEALIGGAGMAGLRAIFTGAARGAVGKGMRAVGKALGGSTPAVGGRARQAIGRGAQKVYGHGQHMATKGAKQRFMGATERATALRTKAALAAQYGDTAKAKKLFDQASNVAKTRMAASKDLAQLRDIKAMDPASRKAWGQKMKQRDIAAQRAGRRSIEGKLQTGATMPSSGRVQEFRAAAGVATPDKAFQRVAGGRTPTPVVTPPKPKKGKGRRKKGRKGELPELGRLGEWTSPFTGKKVKDMSGLERGGHALGALWGVGKATDAVGNLN